MFSHCWLFLLTLTFSRTHGGWFGESKTHPSLEKFPLLEGERRPFPIVVHVWVSRVDTGEHSCIGIRHLRNSILVPEWCITEQGEKRGRIAIYSPKQAGEVFSFSRASPDKRYDEQFNLLYQDDDLRRIIEAPDGSIGTDKPNIVILKTPKISNHYVAYYWANATIFDQKSANITTVVVSWKRGRNGEFFFVQKLVDKSVIEKGSFEGLKTGVEDAAEAVLSISHGHNDTVVFEGFFKQSPELSVIEHKKSKI